MLSEHAYARNATERPLEQVTPCVTIGAHGSLGLHGIPGRSPSIAEQLPYGDYRPGRWAYVLTDIAPVEERCPWCWGDAGVPTGGAFGDAWGWTNACPVCVRAGSCAPVPARGYQGVWEWDPTARPTLRDTPEARGTAEHVAAEFDRLTR